MNNPEENMDHDLASEAEVDICIQSRDRMRRSKSSISGTTKIKVP